MFASCVYENLYAISISDLLGPTKAGFVKVLTLKDFGIKRRKNFHLPTSLIGAMKGNKQYHIVFVQRSGLYKSFALV